MEPDIRVLHLKRSYWGQLLSANARKFINLLNDDQETRLDKNWAVYKSLKQHSDEYKKIPNTSLRHSICTTEALLGDIMKRVMWDLVADAISRSVDHSMFVNYTDIDAVLPDIVRFVGNDCSNEDVKRIHCCPVN